ncbi:copper transporter [Demequina sp. NBRC 110051]|uniref:copper transporter n=1 Tax=Demequina sp. NBRC 110051 TaxID=1570340 RepID=UPI0013562CE8|nr:copper transporter [Demequina sp. NBRC 110051]
MKDFRYHVVSLTAVFLALAIGVVLGSGPMRTALVGEQDERIATLEEDLAAADDEIAGQRDEALAGEQYADETAAGLLPGALEGTSVAVISVGEPAEADVAALGERLVQSGAAVAGQVTLGEAWTDPAQAAFRNSLASTLAPNLVGVDTDAAPNIVLGHALAQALMPGAGPAADDDGDAGERAGLLLELLTESEMISGSVTGDVTGVVMAAGTGADDVEDRTTASVAYADVAGVLADYAQGVAVASGVDHEGDVPSAVRNSPTASALVTTVVTGLDYYGRITTPLALAQNIAGEVATYGPGDGRSMLP